MSVSLYDLLDVDENATPDEIRAAWKAAIADLDPGDRKFRAFNDAAGVLLDEEKRAAYDAELLAERSEAEEPATAVEDEPVVPVPLEKAPPADEPDAPEALDEQQAPEAPDSVATPPPDLATAAPAGSSGPPTWALAVVAVAAALLVALTIVVLSWPGSLGGTSPADQQDQADHAESAASAAEAAAADAIPAVLSYDYRTLDADFDDAAKYLTDDFAAKRNDLFDEKADSGMTLREQVVSDKVVVTAKVWDTGITRVSSDGKRATVVVYVDQDSQKGNQAPRPLKMWATLSMVDDGGDWLLDDICTEDDCG